MSANLFAEDLQWSEAQHVADWWDPYYQKAFPGIAKITPVPGPSPEQRAGIDKFVFLHNGKRIAVDEKLRRDRAPTDICLEYLHVPTDGNGSWYGWIEKPNQLTDYIAMGFAAYRIAFFFPFLTLQIAWKRNKDRWLRLYPMRPAPNPRENPRYHTHCCAIPTDELMGHMLCAMRVQI